FSSRRRHTRWPRDWSSDVCSSDLRSVILVLGGLVLWALLYSQLGPFSRGLVAVLGIAEGTRLHEALAFFAYDTPKVLLLLVLVRSEEHTSELQSRGHLVCRLLLEK